MSDYDLKHRALIENIAKMLGGTTYRDPREAFTTRHMDELRGMGDMLSLAYARRRLPNKHPDPFDVAPEILVQYVTGKLCHYEDIAKEYLREMRLHKYALEMRRFACFVAQGILIGHPLNGRRIELICKMAGVNTRSFAIDVADALAWLYAHAEAAARRYTLAKTLEESQAKPAIEFQE